MTPSSDTNSTKPMASAIKDLREKNYAGHGGQSKCAADFGVSQAVWSRWENGVKAPSARTQKKMADFFGIGIGELWGEEPAATAMTGGRLGRGPDQQEMLYLFSLGFDIQSRVTQLLGYAKEDRNAYTRAITILEVVKRTLDMTAAGPQEASFAEFQPAGAGRREEAEDAVVSHMM